MMASVVGTPKGVTWPERTFAGLSASGAGAPGTLVGRDSERRRLGELVAALAAFDGQDALVDGIGRFFRDVAARRPTLVVAVRREHDPAKSSA